MKILFGMRRLGVLVGIAVAGAWFLCLGGEVSAAVSADQVPTFQWRGRVISSGGLPKAPGPYKFTFGPAGGAVTSTGATWSAWSVFDRAQAAAAVGPHSYPNCYMRGFPVVLHLAANGIADPAQVEVELKFDGTDAVKTMRADLYGPSLGILIWRDGAAAQVASMAEYNRRYWDVLDMVQIPDGERPVKFPIVDRFIGGDSDRTALREGIAALARGGFSAIMLPPDKMARDLLLSAGLKRTAWAVYNPPGYAFAHDTNITPQAIADWASGQLNPYLKAGYQARDMALFAMSDEPGWYYPSAFAALTNNPVALARFHQYLKDQKLVPRDVGAARWEDVLPISRSKAGELPAKRLFYWTMRFYAWDSARHFADSTRALEAVFYTNLPVLVNWNFFSGRFYVPGPVANNPDKKNPDAAMGGHDWLEFGRMRGCTMLWTEDWFGDQQAYQWSYYCARLRCAAEMGGVEFGGYVIPRTAGSRENGILQKILAVVGSGGKAVKYFVFGPEYNFPGNCYSENIKVLPKMAEAHRMIGAAESVLWPGRRPRPQVAILMPRSAQLWDAKDIAVPNVISDATNTDLNRATVDYMAEVFNLYLALQHANIPVDVVDEDNLAPEKLKAYKVLYVTEPNIPEEGQRGLAQWTKDGGVLVTVSGAGAWDRYNEPCRVLAKATGIEEKPRERLLVASVQGLPEAGKGKGALGEFRAIGARGILVSQSRLAVDAAFDDGTPAVVHREVGKGKAVHFAWLPGLSYARTSNGVKDGLPVGWSESVRRWITWPAVTLAGVTAPVCVSVPMVETPMLVSDQGAAVTFLNWSGAPVARLGVTVKAPFKVNSVRSVKQGAITFKTENDLVKFDLALDAADIVMLKP